ncbi:MAG: Lrp/AsnC ligand binding domain-containing protein [Candidatus Nezhaarchaeota archaeon]|nr:Lrp/AsnC ligand binding domain-containing protein [Candidatus Nezhaarchaeota archaeon]
MVKACVLIKAVPTKMDALLKQLKELPQVKKAYFTFGRFDLACFVEARGPGEVAEVAGRINSMDGVRSTETLIEA